MELIRYLNTISGMSVGRNYPEFKYGSIEEFVLKNGEYMQPWPLPEHIKFGESKMCFMNAFQVAESHGLEYVEGYAVSIIPTMHAWCIGEDGHVVDPTWNGGTEYYGVRFPLEFVRKTILRKETWGVLDDYKSGYPLLKGGSKWDRKSVG
jgi:hypothetical protein